MEKKYPLDEKEQEIFGLFSKKMTPKTKHEYLLKILLFKEFLDFDELLNATKEDAKIFIQEIQKKYAKSTCEKIFSYLHSFYNFLVKEEYLKINPFKFVRKPVVSRMKNKDDVLSIQEINKLIDCIQNENLRNQAIIVFLITTGCLLNELVNVKWKDLIVDDEENFYIKLGKRNKKRTVKLHPYCFKLIEEYREYKGLSEIIMPTDEFIFTTQKSNSITDRNVRLIVRKIMDKSGLGDYSSKDFRHSFAAISLMLGACDEELKNQLGWSDKYYAIRYKYVLNLVDSESIDYIMESDKLNINDKI